MEIIHVTGQPPASDEPQVLAIGKFDGVHIGHQEIIRSAKQYCGDTVLSVMSFSPHPAFVLAGLAGYNKSLTPSIEKRALLEALGIQRLYEVTFTKDYARTTAETFVYGHLAGLRLQRIVIGDDYRFGHGGKATVEDLRRLCSEINVPISVVSPIVQGGRKVSSSQIREHLANGRVEAAEALLGRPFTIQGTVEHGDARGRELGFPTANLGGLEEYVLPAAGVYAVSVAVVEDGSGSASPNWFGVLNAGIRPTVDGTTFRVEVHLLDFNGDLYGKTLKVSFLRRIRDERKFSSLDALTAQIAADVEQTSQVLGLIK